MTLTIQLRPDLEARLRDEAARRGLGESDYAVLALEAHFRQAAQVAHVHDEGKSAQTFQQSFTPAELELVRKINLGISRADWDYYHDLVAKRRAETLTPDEYAHLLGLTNRIEEANARPMVHLVDLARLRGVSLEAVMDWLGIRPGSPDPSPAGSHG